MASWHFPSCSIESSHDFRMDFPTSGARPATMALPAAPAAHLGLLAHPTGALQQCDTKTMWPFCARLCAWASDAPGGTFGIPFLWLLYGYLPSGKRLQNYGKIHFLMDKSTISMAIFNSELFVYQRVLGFL